MKINMKTFQKRLFEKIHTTTKQTKPINKNLDNKKFVTPLIQIQNIPKTR